MRNWLAHAYFDINLDILWNVVQDELGPLIVQLESIVAAEFGNGTGTGEENAQSR